MGARDMWLHFTERGHSGRVQCVDASVGADIILTGGVDHSFRAWKYDQRFEAYDLIAVVNTPIPEQPAEEGAGCCTGCCGKTVDWSTEAPQGVTAVHATMSLLVEERHNKDAVPRNGPLLAGDASGSLYVLDLSDVHEDTSGSALVSFDHLHEGKINDLNSVPDPGADNLNFIVGTASEDKTCVLFRMVTEEAPNPNFDTHTHIQRCWLVDAMFFAGGGRTPKASVRDVAQEAVGEEGDEEAPVRQSTTIQEGDEDGNAKTCLRYVSMGGDEDDKAEIARLKHDDPVSFIRFLGCFPEDNEDAACVATCTVKGAVVWNRKGVKLMTLPLEMSANKMWSNSQSAYITKRVMCTEHSGIAACRKYKENIISEARMSMVAPDSEDPCREQAMLFLHGKDDKEGGWVGVWGFDNGIVGKKDGRALLYSKELLQKNEEDEALGTHKFVEPLCAYRRDGVVMDIDQSGDSTTFAVQLDKERENIRLWKTEAVEPGILVVEPDGPASLLRVPGREREDLIMPHPYRVGDLKVVEDTEGPALVVGCDDGTALMWDLEGDDKGQIYAQLRSLASYEILLPPILLIVTAAQVLSFSFGPAVPWNPKVKQNAKIVHNFMMLDFKYTLELDREVIFWTEMRIVCGTFIFFIVSALISLPHRLAALQLRLTNSHAFRHESFGCTHVAIRLVSFTKGTVDFLMCIISTILVVPFCQSCAQALDCDRPADSSAVNILLGNPDKDIYLDSVPSILCYRDDHIKLVTALFCIIPLYIFLLIPYAAVAGDTNAMPPACLFDFRIHDENNQWRAAARRKATEVHLAFLHVAPLQAFRTQTVELLGKILLPAISTWTTQKPMLQMTLISSIGFALWMNSLHAAPYVERKFCVAVQDVKLFTVCAMLTGVFTVYLNDPSSNLPLEVLCVSAVVVLLLFVVQMCCIPAQKPFVRMFTAGQPAARASTKQEEEGEAAPEGNEEEEPLVQDADE